METRSKKTENNLKRRNNKSNFASESIKKIDQASKY